MATLVFAPSARNEIAAIATDIRKENPAAADTWILKLTVFFISMLVAVLTVQFQLLLEKMFWIP